MIKAISRMLKSMDLNRTLIGFILIGGSAISAGTASTTPPEQAQNGATQTIRIKIF